MSDASLVDGATVDAFLFGKTELEANKNRSALPPPIAFRPKTPPPIEPPLEGWANMWRRVRRFTDIEETG